MNPDVVGVFVPIVAIVMGVGIGMLSMWLDYRKKREIFELHHKERMAAIEKGMEVPPLPPELFQSNRRRRTPADSLRNGLVLLLLGVAIGIALYFTDGAGIRVAFWALVPAAIGIAHLIFYALVDRKTLAHPDGDKQR